MASDKKLVPYGMVVEEFEKMPDGLHQFEKAFPGITTGQGYKKYVKVDAQSGAWMIEVPKAIQDEISVHNIVEGSKISNTMASGDNALPVGAGAQAAPMVAARSKLSKDDMKKAIGGGAAPQASTPSPFMASVTPTKLGGK